MPGESSCSVGTRLASAAARAIIECSELSSRPTPVRLDSKYTARPSSTQLGSYRFGNKQRISAEDRLPKPPDSARAIEVEDVRRARG